VILRQTPKFLVGVDEVGRGPIAGPVAVCAFLWKDRDVPLPEKIKDSKKLSPQKREEWFSVIEEWESSGVVSFEVSFVDSNTIDEVGISPSISQALNKALYRLKVDPKNVMILLDGGLYAPDQYSYQETIIKGDENESIIALASIVAKVTRDRYMEKISELYPVYGFDVHKGYGTKDHYMAIKKHGPSPLHRRSFLKKVLTE
jgi:ribonuclease HII